MIQLYLALTVMAICLYFKYKCSFWARRKVDGPAPLPIFGNLFEFVITKKRHAGEIYREIYESYPKARYVGIYKIDEPVLLIRDLDLIKDILVTKFNIFNKNDFAADAKLDPLLAVNPFLVPGDEWKTTRQQLSPLFIASRLRTAVPYINNVSKTLMEYVEGGPESATMQFDVKDLSAKFTTDVVAAVAFGLDGCSFTDPNADFRRMGDDMFLPTFLTGLKQQIVLFMPFMNKFLKVSFISKEVDRKFRSVVNQVVDDRDKNETRRDDLLQVILDLRDKHGRETFTENVVVGHSMTFLTEGYETSSTTMAYTLYEMAMNPEVQEKVQQEIDEVLNGGEFTEEVISKLTYLEQCLMETVRVHCPVFTLAKMSLKETEFPAQYESCAKTLKVEEGTIVIIPVYALHFDKDYFPEPHQYNPDRWSKDNHDSIPKYAFLGFGEGPRICLGMKFALMQVKVGIASILSKYKVTTYAKTETPPKFSKTTFNLQPQNGIWLRFEKRNKK